MIIRAQNRVDCLLTKLQGCIILRCEMPHPVVVSQTLHLNFDETPILGNRNYVFKESIADTQVLPFVFDRECNLCSHYATVLDSVQLDKPSHLANNERSSNKFGSVKDRACVIFDHPFTRPAAEPRPTRRRIKTTEVADDVSPVTALKSTDLHFRSIHFASFLLCHAWSMKLGSAPSGEDKKMLTHCDDAFFQDRLAAGALQGDPPIRKWALIAVE